MKEIVASNEYLMNKVKDTYKTFIETYNLASEVYYNARHKLNEFNVDFPFNADDYAGFAICDDINELGAEVRKVIPQTSDYVSNIFIGFTVLKSFYPDDEELQNGEIVDNRCVSFELNLNINNKSNE